MVDGGLETCLADADCDMWSYGRCGNTPDISLSPPYYCSYGCVRDEDCGTGRICACGPLVGTCIAATCTSDSECGEEVCGQVTLAGPCGPVADHFECRVAGTECAAPSDCGQGETCLAGSCAGAGGVCGRPFLVASEDRRAVASARTDWASGALPELHALTSADRRLLAEHWTRIALMEHASIAAFARFSLALIQLGAPADLLSASLASAMDEEKHARLAFGFASAYGGDLVGPGCLSTTGALDDLDFESVVRTTFLEACIGETIAAMEAAEQLAHATDPAVVAALQRIAADETRHAELGWRFVKWALGRAPLERRGGLARSLVAMTEEAMRRVESVEPERGDDVVLSAHGLISRARSRAVRELSLSSVVLPCARALSDFVEPGGDSVSAQVA
jgi:hypothetical protein